MFRAESVSSSAWKINRKAGFLGAKPSDSFIGLFIIGF